MSEVIKTSLPINRIVVGGEVKINNKIKYRRESSAEEEAEETPETIGEVLLDEAELEALRDRYKNEGREYAEKVSREADDKLANAVQEAERLLNEAKVEAEKTRGAAEKERDKIAADARNEGYERGYGEGAEKGEKDGYEKGLLKCRDSLLELKTACENLEREKENFLQENKRAVFDLAMAVAEKITAAVFNQKDKSVLKKMITEAAKPLRNAKTIKVTLSRVDLSEDIDTEIEVLEKCFPQGAQVEFEILDDAESGTLILETDSGITDAGVSTQLKMIEELGRGKFRDKEPDAPAAAEEPPSDKPKRSAGKKAAKPDESEAAENGGAVGV